MRKLQPAVNLATVSVSPWIRSATGELDDEPRLFSVILIRGGAVASKNDIVIMVDSFVRQPKPIQEVGR